MDERHMVLWRRHTPLHTRKIIWTLEIIKHYRDFWMMMIKALDSRWEDTSRLITRQDKKKWMHADRWLGSPNTTTIRKLSQFLLPMRTLVLFQWVNDGEKQSYLERWILAEIELMLDNHYQAEEHRNSFVLEMVSERERETPPVMITSIELCSIAKPKPCPFMKRPPCDEKN